MVTAVAGATGTSTGSTGVVQTAAADQTQDKFLRLLVTQMKNQDPLNPMDNAQVTSQMAQLSTVTGIEKLNKTLEASTQTQSFQSVGMIGHNILAPGDKIDLTSGKAVGGIELANAADTVKVSIKDANGALVRSLDLGKQDPGLVPFAWDGMTDAGVASPDGKYTFSVDATTAGSSVSPTSLAMGMVQSVLMDKTGPVLSVQGMGLVDQAQVRQVL